MRFKTPSLIVMALVAGIALAPLVLPMIASSGARQRLSRCPGHRRRSRPMNPQRRPHAPYSYYDARSRASATPTRDPEAPILGTEQIITPIVTSIPDDSSSSSATATPTATPQPGTQPDLCEPNASLTQPCSLPTEIENTNLNFVDDSLDVVSLLLKGGRTYTLRASNSTGIDPVIRVYRAEDTATPLVENDDVKAGTTDAEVKVTTDGDGWYLVAIENKAPGSMRGRLYTFSARSSVAEQPTVNATAATQQALRPVTATVGDVYENNYSPETAATLVWGVPYDLSLVCPVPGQCAGGDHVFFWVPVKAGVPFVAVTYDLGPGADPAITLYRPEANFTDPSTGLAGWRSWAGNDDVVPGFTLRSQLLATPDWSGYVLLVVASSERTDPPPMPPAVGTPGRYRLMIGPPGLAAVQQVLAAQSDIPLAPTDAPTVAAPPPADRAAGYGPRGANTGERCPRGDQAG
jgi:hypothetical protein